MSIESINEYRILDVLDERTDGKSAHFQYVNEVIFSGIFSVFRSTKTFSPLCRSISKSISAMEWDAETIGGEEGINEDHSQMIQVK